MSVTEESGGRLNAFAKEPQIEVLDKEASNSTTSRIIIIIGIILVGSLIALTIGIR